MVVEEYEHLTSGPSESAEENARASLFEAFSAKKRARFWTTSNFTKKTAIVEYPAIMNLNEFDEYDMNSRIALNAN